MVFELLTWVFISLVCFAWGGLFLQFFIRQDTESELINFPMIAFIGLSVIGLVCWYFSLFVPLYNWIKLLLFFSSVVYFLNKKSRKFFADKLRFTFQNYRPIDFLLLFSVILMVLFLSSSRIIHPDTLNYHADAIRLYSYYGMIPGIANLKTQFGFQSLWFAVMNLFELERFQPSLSFPLSGCAVCWFVIFLISRSSGKEYELFSLGPGQWERPGYMLLLVFTLLSWTQVRLTAASASPDFIAAISVFCSFLFLVQKTDSEKSTICLYLSVFFALISVTIKTSVIVILLIPVFVFLRAFSNRDKKLISFCLAVSIVVLCPFLIRNFVSAGYPLYPSSLGGLFPVDWKMHVRDVEHLRQYITDYARLQVVPEDAAASFNIPISIWFPKWWVHLYIPDKVILLLILMGLIIVLVFFKKWKIHQSVYCLAGCLIALTGFVVWFLNAPDPRFGTSFMLPLIFFLYSPFLLVIEGRINSSGILKLLKGSATVVVFLYSGYRFTHFFQASQVFYPSGITQKASPLPTCDELIKNMLFTNRQTPFLLRDSCKTYHLRGRYLKDGFSPREQVQ